MAWIDVIFRRLLPEGIKVRLREARSARRQSNFTVYTVEKCLLGVDFVFHVGDAFAREWYDQRISDAMLQELAFLQHRVIEKGDVILECGAHHGFTTVLLAKWVGPTGRVIAFEPVARNAAILRRNVELNGLTNVVVESKAVGARAGSCRITNESNARITTVRGSRPTVDLVCLDAYLALRPTLLKIDVEGYELEVLTGAQSILARKPKLAIEVHGGSIEKYGGSAEDLRKLVDLAAYDLWLDRGDGVGPEPCAQLGLITRRAHLFALPKPPWA